MYYLKHNNINYELSENVTNEGWNKFLFYIVEFSFREIDRKIHEKTPDYSDMLNQLQLFTPKNLDYKNNNIECESPKNWISEKLYCPICDIPLDITNKVTRSYYDCGNFHEFYSFPIWELEKLVFNEINSILHKPFIVEKVQEYLGHEFAKNTQRLLNLFNNLTYKIKTFKDVDVWNEKFLDHTVGKVRKLNRTMIAGNCQAREHFLCEIIFNLVSQTLIDDLLFVEYLLSSHETDNQDGKMRNLLDVIIDRIYISEDEILIKVNIPLSKNDCDRLRISND